MPAAAKHTPLVWLTVIAFVAVSLVAASAASPPNKDSQAPTMPKNLRVTAATSSGVTLAWDPSSDDVRVVGYYVQGDRGKAIVTLNLDRPQYVVDRLDCGKSAQLSVSAFDDAGNRSERATAIVSAAACVDTRPPTPPSGFTQVATTQTAVVLAWRPSTDDVGVVGYGVYRNLARIANTVAPTVTLSGLTCGKTYEYALDSVDAAGNRSLLVKAFVNTSACSPPPPPAPAPGDRQAPSTPSGLAASGITQTSMALRWNASSDNTGVTGYDVYRNGVKVASPTSTTVSLGGLACATAYSWGVQARDAAGNASPQAKLDASTAGCFTLPPAPDPTPAPGDSQAPSTPSGLAASAITPTSMALRWNASSDNTGVTGYDVYRNGVKVASPTSTGVSLGGLACATAYSWGVQARDAAGNASPQAKLDASTAACSVTTPPPPPAPAPGDSQPPSTPSGLKVSSATETSVSLAWNASTDNVRVAGYRTYRDRAHVSTGTQTSSTVSGLACGHAYSFEVDALDGAGNASGRASVIGSTLACPDTEAPTAPTTVVASTRTATSIALTWRDSFDDVAVVEYGLYRGGVKVGTALQTTAIFSGLACGTGYTLAVDAADAAGNRSAQAPVLVSTLACPDGTAPSIPTGLAAANVTQTGLTLSWTASTDNVGVTAYDVYRNSTKIATVSSPSSAQSGLTCGTSYSFGVVARDAAGNSSTEARLTASTAPCSPVPPPPGAPSGRWFADSSPWNTPIAAGTPSVSQSSGWITALHGAIGMMVVNQGAWTPNVFVADASTPRGSVALPNGWRFEDIPLPATLRPSSDSDAHAVIIDASRGREYDFFSLRGGPGSWTASAGIVLRLGGSGWYDGAYCEAGVCGPWGARASSAALGGGLIRASEAQAGVIPHALSCAAPKHLIGPAVSPATTSDGSGGSGAMPMGSRLQLDPALNVSSLGLEPGEEMIARALQTYGAYIVESSSSFACYAQNFSTLGSNPYPGSWSNGIRRDLVQRMRVVVPSPRPAYDSRTVFGQPHL